MSRTEAAFLETDKVFTQVGADDEKVDVEEEQLIAFREIEAFADTAQEWSGRAPTHTEQPDI